MFFGYLYVYIPYLCTYIYIPMGVEVTQGDTHTHTWLMRLAGFHLEGRRQCASCHTAKATFSGSKLGRSLGGEVSDQELNHHGFPTSGQNGRHRTSPQMVG